MKDIGKSLTNFVVIALLFGSNYPVWGEDPVENPPAGDTSSFVDELPSPSPTPLETPLNPDELKSLEDSDLPEGSTGKESSDKKVPPEQPRQSETAPPAEELIPTDPPSLDEEKSSAPAMTESHRIALNPDSFGFNKPVAEVLLQTDGKIVVAGSFSTFDGNPVGFGVTRILPNGDMDKEFVKHTIPLFSKSDFYAATIQKDGKIVLGGVAEMDEASQGKTLVRLTASGEIDSAFMGAVGEGFDEPVVAVLSQSDGRLLTGGNFGSFKGVPLHGIARLLPNGGLDQEFVTNVGKGIGELSSVKSFALQKDGKIIVAGDFDTFNGRKVDGFIRLLPNGTIDLEFLKRVQRGFFAGFKHITADDYELDTGIVISKVAIQDDGKIILGGEFVSYDEDNKVYASRLIRLDAEGNIDLPFIKKTLENQFQSDVGSLLVQNDGKIIVGSVDPFSRLSPDGTHDMQFLRLAGYGFRGHLNSIVMQPNGKILVAGKFDSYKGIKVGNLARVNPDGTLDEKFLSYYR